MLLLIQIPIILVAALMALVFQGRWYRYSLILIALSVLLLIYALVGNSGTNNVSILNCHASVHVCAERKTAPFVRSWIATQLSLLLSSVALLLAFRKRENSYSNISRSHSIFRRVAIVVSLLVLFGTFAFLMLIFYALSQI
jgi:hypothetical protein